MNFNNIFLLPTSHTNADCYSSNSPSKNHHCTMSCHMINHAFTYKYKIHDPHYISYSVLEKSKPESEILIEAVLQHCMYTTECTPYCQAWMGRMGLIKIPFNKQND